MLPADLHMHTLASHGKNTVKEMHTEAINKHIVIQGFSEHSPRPNRYQYPIEYREKLLTTFPLYVEEVQKIVEMRQDTYKILLGIELDWLPNEFYFMHQTVYAYAFDYVIGGIHFLEMWGFDFTLDDWSKLTVGQCYKYYNLYFYALKEMAESGFFHIAAHPDLIKIFSVDIFKQWLTELTSYNIIVDALIAIRDAGMSMEISSAGLRKLCREIYPCKEVMTIAAQLKVPICFGSDAHCKNTIGFAFNELVSYAMSFGYQSYQIFEKGQPRTIFFN